jgi:hypothetical protein
MKLLLTIALYAAHISANPSIDFPPGTFVYAHYYPEHYYNQFNIIPLDVMIIDESVSKLVNLTDPLDHVKHSDSFSTYESNTRVFKKYIAKSLSEAVFTSIDEFEPDKKYPPREYNTYVRWAGDSMGWGLFVRRRIIKHDYLNMYTGIVVPNTVVKNTDYAWQYNWKAQYNTTDGEPVKLLIDGLRYGNELRFVNHGEDVDLNVGNYDTSYGDHWYVVYQAKRDLHLHEQLFVSYGSNYWSTRKNKV